MTTDLRVVGPGETPPDETAPHLTPDQQKEVLGVLPWIEHHVRTTFPHATPSDRDDMVQWARLGAAEAARRFDPTSDAVFLTFCKARIAGAIVDWLRREHRQTLVKRLASRAARAAAEDLPGSFKVVFDSEAVNEERLTTCAMRLMAAMAAGIAAAQLSPEEAHRDAEQYERAIEVVRAAHANMSEAERKVFRLRYVDDMALKDIGMTIGVAYITARRWHDQLLDRIALALVEADVSYLPSLENRGSG